MATARKPVFVSYSHADRKWADELVTFLAPWIRDKRVDLWDDSRIQPGENWRTEIQKTIEEATVAVLLVTKDFLASDFISKYELPVLLDRARKNQVRLAWVAVGYSGVQATELSRFQGKRLSKPLRGDHREVAHLAGVKWATSASFRRLIPGNTSFRYCVAGTRSVTVRSRPS